MRGDEQFQGGMFSYGTLVLEHQHGPQHILGAIEGGPRPGRVSRTPRSRSAHHIRQPPLYLSQRMVPKKHAAPTQKCRSGGEELRLAQAERAGASTEGAQTGQSGRGLGRVSNRGKTWSFLCNGKTELFIKPAYPRNCICHNDESLELSNFIRLSKNIC